MDALTRKQACLLVGAAPLLLAGAVRSMVAAQAHAEEATAQALASAQEQYNQVQAQIDELAAQQQELSIQLDATLGSIEDTQVQIDDTQAQIDATQAELQQCQDDLATYISNGYKYGDTTALDVLLSSSSFEELAVNIYYLSKVSESEAQLIEHTKQVKQQLEDQQAVLQEQYAQLDALRVEQETQLADMQARQEESYSLLYSLDAEVQALTAQYNEELMEQARAAEEARIAAEQAAAQQAAASGGSSGGDAGYSDGGGSYDDGGSSWGGGSSGYGSASAVVNACYSTPSPGAGYCAAWVTYVFQNAGIGSFYGNACDMYASWCYSSDMGSIQPGMIVAVSSHSATAAGRIYGHVGIYIGGGTVMDNIGYIRSIDLGSWVSFYGDIVTPRWGWLGGVALG